MKPAWENRRRGIKLYRGDCLRILPALRCQADFLLADPCYGTTNAAWDVAHDYAALLPSVGERLRPGAIQAWFACGKFTFTLAAELGDLFRYDLVWQKSFAVGFLDSGQRPLRGHEAILIAADRLKGSTYNVQKVDAGTRKRKGRIVRKGKDSTLYGGHKPVTTWRDRGWRHPTSVLSFASEPHHVHRLHPTQKPVPLLEWLIRTYTDPGDLVLDFCFGSGSTAIACINTGRRFVGIERDRTFFARAVRRVENHLTQLTERGLIITVFGVPITIGPGKQP